jgi:hypothetical protein
MTDHERAAMEAAIAETISRIDIPLVSIHALIEHGWIAGRAYEPPTSEAKKERQPRCLVCDRTQYGHESPYAYTQKHGHPFVAAPSEAR